MTDEEEAVEAGISQVAAEPTEDQQEAMVGSAGERQREVQDTVGADVPLVLKMRGLMKAGERPPPKENVVAKDVGPGRDIAEQGAVSRE